MQFCRSTFTKENRIMQGVGFTKAEFLDESKQHGTSIHRQMKSTCIRQSYFARQSNLFGKALPLEITHYIPSTLLVVDITDNIILLPPPLPRAILSIQSPQQMKYIKSIYRYIRYYSNYEASKSSHRSSIIRLINQTPGILE